MSIVLYWLARAALGLVQLLPLRWVAWLGRSGGGLAWFLDARHRKVACKNIALAFPAKTEAEVRALARENFRRIGENFACAARTAWMPLAELRRNVSFSIPAISDQPPCRTVVAIGHFGNFELYARFSQISPGYVCAATFRGLRQPGLDQLLRSLREHSGCEFFDRRFDVRRLRSFMAQPNTMLGLLADQHAGDSGLELPFFGHQCSTSAAPAVMALRYGCRLLTGFCYRTSLARWHLECDEEIPTHVNGQPRPVDEIMADVNRSFEKAICRDPANWFWVHNRWKLKWKREGHPRGNPNVLPRVANKAASHG